MSRHYTHNALNVTDVFASAAFYRDWCGLDVLRTYPSSSGGQPVLHIGKAGESHYTVLVPGRLQHRHNNTTNISHMGFEVDSRKELVGLFEKAKREGRLHQTLQKLSHAGELFMVRDPDGYVVEFSFEQDVKKGEEGPPCPPPP